MLPDHFFQKLERFWHEFIHGDEMRFDFGFIVDEHFELFVFRATRVDNVRAENHLLFFRF